MLTIPPEEKPQLDTHLIEAAKILRKYTEVEKLKDFESIELEVRKQVLEVVSPEIGAFFVSPKRKADRKDSKSEDDYRRLKK